MTLTLLNYKIYEKNNNGYAKLSKDSFVQHNHIKKLSFKHNLAQDTCNFKEKEWSYCFVNTSLEVQNTCNFKEKECISPRKSILSSLGDWFKSLVNKKTSPKINTNLNSLEILKDVEPLWLENESIKKIQTGILGRSRNNSELQTTDLIKLITAQELTTIAKDIEKIVNSFPNRDKQLVKKIITNITQFANYKDLETIAMASDFKKTNKRIYVDNKNSLPQVLNYLANNKCLFNKISFDSFRATENVKNSTIILDEIILQKIENDFDFANEIRKNLDNITLLTPESWITGINPFNQTNDLKTLTKEILEKVKAIQATAPNAKEDTILKCVINEPVLKRLEKHGIPSSKLIFIKNTNNFATMHSANFNKIIARKLNNSSITYNDFARILGKFDKSHQPFLKELLAQTININSPKSTSMRLQKIYECLKKINNGTDEGIYYFVAVPYKSFSIVNMQYQLTNNIPSSKFITERNLRDLPLDTKKIVILDDIAGSGQSLGSQHSYIKKRTKNKNIDIIVAPILQTQEAQIHFQKKGIQYITTQTLKNFFNSKWYKSLPSKHQKLYKKLSKQGSWGACNTSVTFPYMTPDNNNAFFSTMFGKYFTLNGKGVKNCIREKYIKNEFGFLETP